MRRGWILAVALLVPGLASAEAPKSFAALRDKATPTESISAFLASFMGECSSDPLDGADCKKKVEAFRKDAVNKTFYVILPDEAQKLVQQRGFNPNTHEMEFALTPFFESGGQAVTNGQPSHIDADGRPVIPLIRMIAKLDDTVMPMDVDRAFRTGSIRMQVIFKPQGVWKIPRKDKKGAFVEGVKAQVLAVRLSEFRSGNTLVNWPQ